MKPDASTVAALVYEHIATYAPTQTTSDEYGERMASAMVMNGKTGKVAKVTAGWILDSETDRIRLTTIYVNE